MSVWGVVCCLGCVVRCLERGRLFEIFPQERTGHAKARSLPRGVGRAESASEGEWISQIWSILADFTRSWPRRMAGSLEGSLEPASQSLPRLRLALRASVVRLEYEPLERFPVVVRKHGGRGKVSGPFRIVIRSGSGTEDDWSRSRPNVQERAGFNYRNASPNGRESCRKARNRSRCEGRVDRTAELLSRNEHRIAIWSRACRRKCAGGYRLEGAGSYRFC